MKNPYLSLLGTAWKYARSERKRFLLVYGMFFCANVVIAINPLVYGWFIDSLQKDSQHILSHAWMYVGAFFVLRFLEWCFHGPARVMERKLAFNISRNFLAELFHQVLRLPIHWHQDNHSGATINRVRKGYEALKDFFQNGFIILHAFGKFFFSFIAMLYFSPLFGSVAVVIGAFTIWVIMQFDKPYIKSIKEINEKEHIVSSNLFDSLSNIVTVITLRLEKRIEKSFLSKVSDVYPPFLRNITVNEWKWFTAQMLIALIYVIIVISYVYQHWQPGETFMIGGLAMLLLYVNQFTSVFNDIALQYTRIVQYNADVETATVLSDAYRKEHRPETTGSLPENWKVVDIHHLNFARSNSTPQNNFGGLNDINLHLERGKKIALIGESGSGKSTLLAILRGLYNTEPGTLVSVDTKEEDFANIPETVTLFPQDPEIFENTILYNITLGLPFEEEEVMKVCEVAQFAEVVKQLPHGLNSHIQEKGVNLSGGQKQRLALARGILSARTSNIVLLDEPTSSVDPKTEVFIYEKLFDSFADKAIVSSLHRLHLLNRFDYIYIMENGRIADEGTFKHLRASSPIFQKLWEHQEDKEGLLLN